MSVHQRFSSVWPNEALAGYSRAVRAGNLVWVAGTTATDGDRVVAPGDLCQRCRRTLTRTAGRQAELTRRLAVVPSPHPHRTTRKTRLPLGEPQGTL